MKNTGNIRVGIGGWVFPPWRGTFYPAGTRQADELAHASRHVTAIEINGTFYRTQTPASFRKWRDETPEGFVFSLKGPRFLTHRSELASAAPYMQRFFDSGFLDLGDKLGPILWQFAPTLQFDAADFAAFLALLPAELGGRAMRHVVEVRHPSFRVPGFFDLLRERRIAVAQVEDAKYPAFDEVTAPDFVYLRLRRCAEEEATGYPPAALDAWAARVRDWAGDGRDVFLYFINGAKVRAPAAAQALLARLR
ncbi:MAG TPA: DUF72 domain-containing protein [Stellaceae bacterium]|nr:DUF72 domain-containing protein [Stellaceae bacterium]